MTLSPCLSCALLCTSRKARKPCSYLPRSPFAARALSDAKIIKARERCANTPRCTPRFRLCSGNAGTSAAFPLSCSSNMSKIDIVARKQANGCKRARYEAAGPHGCKWLQASPL